MSKASGSIDLKSLKVAGEGASKYITDITNNGIKVASATASNLNYVTIDATGMEIFKSNGANSPSSVSIAKFGETTIIGKGANSGESYLQLNYNSMQLKDKEGNPYFYVSDLRNESGVATVTEIFQGDGTKTSFNFQVDALNTNYTVTVSDSSGGTVTRRSTGVTFSSAPNSGSKITVTYTTDSPYVKVYTFGTRNNEGTIGIYSFAEGDNIVSSGNYSHAEGNSTKAEGLCSHAEGQDSNALSSNAHAEGYGTTASGENSHAEGSETEASGRASHAEGYNTTASKYASHAEGYNTTASQYEAHAEGSDTTASGQASHSEGWQTSASGLASHAEGTGTTAEGNYSHASGQGTKARRQSQFVIGEYNVEETGSVASKGTYAFIIGSGTSDSARSNAFSVAWNGNVIDGSGTQLINKAMVACGTTGGVTIAANSTAYIDVSFGKTFSHTPIVVCSIYSTSTAYTDIGKIRCWVTSVSTTGCRIYFYNQASSQRAPAAYWQAIAI